MPTISITIKADEEAEGQRLDRWLTEQFLNTDTYDLVLSRSSISRNIKEGNITVNSAKTKPSATLKEGDEVFVRVDLEFDEPPKPFDFKLDIRYEDDDLIVLNKPFGMVTHPTETLRERTLVNALLAHTKRLPMRISPMRPGIVQRLDKDTTGLMVIAKTERAYYKLRDMIKYRTLKRIYKALVYGNVKKDRGSLVFPIGRNPSDRRKMCVNSPEGRDSITHYQVLERFPGATLVECKLETGRTHQIRVHMHHIGHGLIGDIQYCAKESYREQRLESDLRDAGIPHDKMKEVLDRVIPLNGQLLTSHRIGFPHPFKDDRVIDIRIDLPDRFQAILNLFDSLR